MLLSLLDLCLRRAGLDRLPAIVARSFAEPDRQGQAMVGPFVVAVLLVREATLAVVAAMAWRSLFGGVLLQLDSLLRRP